jgi:P4 family phage/plasmid primase-like protien
MMQPKTVSPLPHAVPEIEASVPETLRTIPHWITWVRGAQKTDGKFEKLPKGQDGTGNGWQHPDQWMPFKDALAIAQRRGHAGVGFVLPAQTEDGLYVVALDFDGVDLQDPNSARLQEIQDIHHRLGSPYVEVSPSGRGVRMFVLSSELLPQITASNPHGGKDELFCASPKWVTVTGEGVGGSGVPVATQELAALCRDWQGRTVVNTKPPSAPPAPGGVLNHLTGGWLGWPEHKLRDGDGREEMMLAFAGHLRAKGLPQEEIERRCLDANQEHYEDLLDESAVLDRARRYQDHGSPLQESSERLLASHGDIRNARAFANTHRDRLIYVTTRDKWLQWRDGCWVLCEKEEEVAKAKLVCSQILTAATQVFAQDQERGRRLVQEAVTAHNLTKVTAMLKLAISEPGMATTDRELDTDPHMLGVSNGVVDLRTGRLQRNEPRLKVTRYCGAAYVQDRTCPKWLQFLDQIFSSDVDTIETVQLLLGYTLVGISTEEKLIICYGHGSNGKSVFSNVVQKIIGGYAVTAPPSLLTARKSGDTSPRNDLAALAGARLVSINETQAGDRLDEQIVKMLAGREPIAARFLHQEFFEYTPAFTPWLRTNHKPIVTGSDDGIWRRLVLLPFRRKFSDDEKDPGLEDKLLQERDGILGWMIDGAIKYLKDGLILSPRIKAEINTYRKDSDVLGEFLDENATVGGGEKVDQATLYQRFRSWCADSGLHICAKKTFTQRLAERGFSEAKSGARRWYLGLRLNS